MTAVQNPSPSLGPPPMLESPRRPMWLWLVGLAVLLVSVVVLGNFALWAGRTNANVPETYTDRGAAVYTGLVAPQIGSDDVLAAVRTGQQFDEIDVQTALVVGTARTVRGDVDLVTFSGPDTDGFMRSCIALMEGFITSSTCDAGPIDGIQVFWGETSTSEAIFFTTVDRSLTVFNAPPEAGSIFVLLDSNRYVGADVREGVSHVAWKGDLGKAERLMVFDAAGGEVYRQEIDG